MRLRVCRIGVAAALAVAGCAFTMRNQSAVRPEALISSGAPIEAAVGLRFVPEREGQICGDAFQGFAEYLREHRVFTAVAAPVRPEEPVDVVLEVQFNCRTDEHDARNSVVAFVEGFGLLAPTLLALHDIDVTVDAQVTIRRAEEVLARYEVRSRYDANASYFGVVNHPERLVEMSQLASGYAYDQLASRFRQDRHLFEESGALLDKSAADQP